MQQHSTVGKTTEPSTQSRSSIDQFFEIIYWLRIVIAPLIVGGILGFLVYLYIKDTAGIVAGGLVALAGLVAGILWANSIKRKQGTVNFMSRVNAVRELREED